MLSVQRLMAWLERPNSSPYHSHLQEGSLGAHSIDRLAHCTLTFAITTPIHRWISGRFDNTCATSSPECLAPNPGVDEILASSRILRDLESRVRLSGPIFSKARRAPRVADDPGSMPAGSRGNVGGYDRRFLER